MIGNIMAYEPFFSLFFQNYNSIFSSMVKIFRAAFNHYFHDGGKYGFLEYLRMNYRLCVFDYYLLTELEDYKLYNVLCQGAGGKNVWRRHITVELRRNTRFQKWLAKEDNIKM